MIKYRVLIGLMVNSYKPAFGMPGHGAPATRSHGINRKVYRQPDCAWRTGNEVAPAG
jgi:hypothetical protein